MKRLVLAGGGHAHIEVLRRFARHPPQGCSLVLVTPYPWLTYSGMVPGYVAGHYALQDCTIDLAALCASAGADLRVAPVTALDADARRIACADGRTLDYDLLSLDVGSRPATDVASGVERHSVVMRPLERFVKGWNEVLPRAREGDVHSITLVGTGAAGIELAFAMHQRLAVELPGRAPLIRIIGDSARPVPEFSAAARRRLRAEIVHRGIESHHGSGVVEVGEGFVRLRSGLEFASDAVFWAAGSAAHAWIAASNLATNERGYAVTNESLRSVSHANVFAAGDCASPLGRSVPKAGVFAVRAGPVLADNLRAALAGHRLRVHSPNPRYLALISGGDRYAIGTWDGLSWEGKWVWRWKDRIDRAFVARYRRAA